MPRNELGPAGSPLPGAANFEYDAAFGVAAEASQAIGEIHLKRPLILCLLALAAAGCGAGRETSPPDTPAAEQQALAAGAVTGEAFRRHMEILAADEMEGREAGTPGFQMAAEYVARQYRAIGLEPLGDGGSYYQSIDFFETRLVPESARVTLHKEGRDVELVLRDDFVCSGGYGDAEEETTAPLVFVGHGIIAPEYGHDDFDGVEARGKILVALSGAPPRFDTDQRAFYSSSQGKQALASRLGAVGLITVRTPVDQERRPWARYLPGIGAPGMRWLDERGEPFEAFPELAGTPTLSEAGAEKLFALSGHDLTTIFEKHAEGGTGSFDMGVSATLARASRQGTISSSNVLGLLGGSDPELREEHIVYTAHLDHIGIRPGEDGDDIHNGAYDNAAGIAAMLEIARAMAGMETSPRRPVIFAAVTAEEKGLQGSSYFAKHPPVPTAQIVANLNLDMPYLAFPMGDIEAFGAEHSSLLGSVVRATEAMGLALTPDSKPEEVRFIRSDQFSFVEEGIPALAFHSGSNSSDPNIDGGAMLEDFLKNHYHRPSDDLDLPFSAEGAERFVRAALLLGLFVAEEDVRPRWNEEDFFGEKFAK